MATYKKRIENLEARLAELQQGMNQMRLVL